MRFNNDENVIFYLFIVEIFFWKKNFLCYNDFYVMVKWKNF